jgi:hypothetical protein
MKMDLNFKRRARERRIAAEIANELYHALRPAMDKGPDAETLMAENRGLVAHIFGIACERHQLATEAAAARVLAYVPSVLAEMNRRFEDLNKKFEKLNADF